MSEDEQPGLTMADSTRGAQYTVLHQERRVKIYPIQEHELTTIGVFNSQVILWCSVASIAATLFLGCLWDLSQMPDSSEATSGSMAFAGICFIAIILATGLAWMNRQNRNDQLRKILDECSLDQD